jgi:peroxiredoxin
MPLLSDMNRKVLIEYGILKKYNVQGDDFEWARRTTIVVDKEGKIQHVEFDESAVNPNNALAVCTGLHEKHDK